jgi:hypothetical protein
MNTVLKWGIWGFGFGSVGLYAVGAFGLAIRWVEVVAGPLLFPGRFAAGVLFPQYASDGAVLLLICINGLFYAAVFAFVGWVLQPKIVRGD